MNEEEVAAEREESVSDILAELAFDDWARGCETVQETVERAGFLVRRLGRAYFREREESLMTAIDNFEKGKRKGYEYGKRETANDFVNRSHVRGALFGIRHALDEKALQPSWPNAEPVVLKTDADEIVRRLEQTLGEKFRRCDTFNDSDAAMEALKQADLKFFAQDIGEKPIEINRCTERVLDWLFETI